ncbi:hypothetical protein [Arthrobacter cryoconiti]|uniref:DUF304 domain-containing protein n=1 Tax=Arthrobacter cryoconiti TaxID=748907 RepID=A0ABV8R314_9MICC|nr:hypothetical protein [Arthrobacter cryoconiti]MCC9067764.1 hypothetical protein [Arthrobacter cryoconiti]
MPAPLWRRLLRQPLLWAALCVGLALPWYFTENALELPPFLLTLVGGWLCGFAFVNFTFAMKNVKYGLLVHLVGAAIFGLILRLGTLVSGSMRAHLPQPVLALSYLVILGSIPAAGWVWLGLLSRVTSARWFVPRKEKPVRIAPAWEFRTTHRFIRFSAIRMPLRTLGWIIAAVVVVLGSVTTITLIATDLIRYISSGTLFVFLFGTAIALPAYFILTTLLKRKTVTCTVEFAPDHMQIDAGTEIIRLGLADLDRFLWRCESDYARLEVRGGGHDISLITGIARVPSTVLPELPKLPGEIARRLAAAGLVQQRTRRVGVTVFTRLSVCKH